MKRKFLLLVMMCLLGGFSSSLMAQDDVTIGATGTTESAIYPYISTYNYSTSQQIYKAAEIGKAGTISKISFYVNDPDVNKKVYDVKIYIKHTTKNAFSGKTDWDKTVTSDHLVFEGTAEITNSVLGITLDTQFAYDGIQNLLVCFDVNSKQGAATYYRTYSADSKRVMYHRNSNNVGPDATTYYNNDGSSFPANTVPMITLTFGGDATAKDPEFTDTYAYPDGEYATNVIKPSLSFKAENKTHYKVLLSTTQDFSSDVRYVAGSEKEWVKDERDEISTSIVKGLKYNPATKYYWKVVARNGDTDDVPTKESSVYSFTTKAVTAAPAKAKYNTNPYNGEICTTSYPNLKWEYDETTFEYKVLVGTNEELKDDKDADGDYVQNNDIKQNWTDANLAYGNSYQTSGLAVGTYYWRVDVKNDEGITKGDVYSFTIPGVENISNATADVNNKVLSWTFAEGTSQYKVLLGRATTENPEHPYEFLTEHQTDWMDVTNENGTFTLPTDNIVAGATYYWAVDVKNYADQKIYFNKIKDRTPIKNENGVITGWEPAVYEHQVEVYSFVTSTMSKVDNTSPKSGTISLENSPELKWSFNGSSATYYQVYLGTDPDKLEAQGWMPRESVEVGGIKEYKANGSFETSNLKEATKYYWRVDVTDAQDVTADDITVYEGDTWWFGTKLPTPEAQAIPEQILPTFGNYGGTTINWSLMSGAQGYNVYHEVYHEKDTLLNQLNTSLITTNRHPILASEQVLSYNVENGHNIYVEADFGELGKSMSEAVNVKVSGKGTFSVAVFKNNIENRLEGATVTLTFVKDEFERTPSGDGIITEYVYQTNQYGQAYVEQTINGTTSQTTNISLINGTYKYKVEKTDYTTEEGYFVIKNNESYPLSVTLTSNNIFEVTILDESFYSVKINLATNKYGNYHVYLVKNGTQQYLGEKTFDLNQDNTVSWTYTDWANLGKGSYQFCVSTREGGELNWNEEGVIMRYDVFEGSGDWTNTSCWRDKELPKETDDVYILANAEIAKGSDIKVGNVYIEQNNQSGSSLTINGSLTAKMVYNNAKAGSLCINEGGQLRQNNEELNGKFVMTVTPPTSWDESNIDGWQFIASPVEGVEFSKFVPANEGQGDYDLYQYDGENNKWRNHKHVYGEGEEAFVFGDKFELGTAYLAALQYEKDVTFSGVLNAAQTYKFNVSHNEEKNAANYHLLGNPFTFAMDVKNFKATGLATGYAVLNAKGNEYLYLIEGQIPVGNGFFVMATEATASLTYSETAARGAAEETANINIVAKGATGSNNVIINMANDKEGFRKLEGFNKEIANIYVENKGNKYAIYNCESDVNEVELTFVAKQMGSYSLSFDINGEFETVTLVDRMTGVETDMIAEGEYNFIATSNDMKNRFVVRLSNSMTATEEFLANFVYQSGEELIINAEGAIQIIDMMGRVVYSNENANGNDRINVSEFNNAAYVVRVINSNGVKSQKVVIY